MENQLEKYIKVVSDFPKPGVLFRDVTGILDSGEGFRLAMIEMERALAGVHIDKVAALIPAASFSVLPWRTA